MSTKKLPKNPKVGTPKIGVFVYLIKYNYETVARENFSLATGLKYIPYDYFYVTGR